jgi:hypothetical protein
MAVHYAPGDSVDDGAELIDFETRGDAQERAPKGSGGEEERDAVS